MSRKALFFDVDGTLLSEKTRRVPESAVQALRQTREKGNLVFINSGRTFCLLQEIRRLVPADGFLCGCGTCVILDGETVYHRRIPAQRARQIKAAIPEYGFDGVLEAMEGIYFRKERPWIRPLAQLKDRLAEEGAVSPLTWEDGGYDVDKFCVYADADSRRQEFFDFLRPDFQVIDRGGDFYECVPAGCSKATAIDWTLKRCGIPKEDAYVFGDSSNDLPMFEYAENAVLMGSHDAVLEPYATFVTRTVEEDGIAYACQQLGLF